MKKVLSVLGPLVILTMIFTSCSGAAATEPAAPTAAEEIATQPPVAEIATEKVEETPLPVFATPIKEDGANLVAYGSSLFFLLDDFTVIGGPKSNFEYERTIAEITGDDRRIVAVMYYVLAKDQYLVAPIDGNPIKLWVSKSQQVYACESEPCRETYYPVTGTLVTKVIEWYSQSGELEIANALSFWHPAIKNLNACIASRARFGVVHYCFRDGSLPAIPSITPTSTSTPTNTPTTTPTTAPTSTRTMRPSPTPTNTKAPTNTPTPSSTPITPTVAAGG